MEDKSKTLGIFHRAFPVELPAGPIRFMTADVKKVTDLDRLRYQKWVSKSESSVFTFGGRAFGYGNGMERFADDGFSETKLLLKDSPELAEGLIVEGLVDDARTRERHYFGIYRNCCKMIPDSGFTVRNGYLIKIGYYVRAVHWELEEQTMFGLIIEPTWTIRRNDARSEMAVGCESVTENDLLRIHSADFSEDYALGFVYSHAEFVLPCGGKARLLDDPVTVFGEAADKL